MDAQSKKQVLRTFTYGLYAVSCANEGEVNIFTANWLTQVSFDPPLIAVSVENASKSLPMILRSRKFTVNVLRSGDRELAGQHGRCRQYRPYAIGCRPRRQQSDQGSDGKRRPRMTGDDQCPSAAQYRGRWGCVDRNRRPFGLLPRLRPFGHRNCVR